MNCGGYLSTYGVLSHSSTTVRQVSINGAGATAFWDSLTMARDICDEKNGRCFLLTTYLLSRYSFTLATQYTRCEYQTPSTNSYSNGLLQFNLRGKEQSRVVCLIILSCVVIPSYCHGNVSRLASAPDTSHCQYKSELSIILNTPCTFTARHQTFVS